MVSVQKADAGRQRSAQAGRSHTGRPEGGRWIGEQKAKAAKLEETPAGGNAHTVRPLQERVHVAANKALGQIQRDAEKVDPDTSLSAAKRRQVIELLEKVSKLTK